MPTSDQITAYRLIDPRFRATPLSGEGVQLYGGRWNSPGRPVLYLASTRSLAALELLCHLTTSKSRSISRMLLTIQFPSDLARGKLSQTYGWNNAPPTAVSTQQGDDWLEYRTSAVVRAPSAIIAEEDNYLVNPQHNDFSTLEVVDISDFSFDPRLTG